MKKGLWTGIWDQNNQVEDFYISTNTTGKYRLCEKKGKLLLQQQVKDERIAAGTMVIAERLRWKTVRTAKEK